MLPIKLGVGVFIRDLDDEQIAKVHAKIHKYQNRPPPTKQKEEIDETLSWPYQVTVNEQKIDDIESVIARLSRDVKILKKNQKKGNLEGLLATLRLNVENLKQRMDAYFFPDNLK